MPTIDYAQIITAEAKAAAQQAAYQAAMTAAIDAVVEATARARSYNSAAHLASYVASTVPGWAAEAQAFVAWRDAVWVTAITALGTAQSTGVPPTQAALLSALPQIVWPS
jgi:hypothetical protein